MSDPRDANSDRPPSSDASPLPPYETADIERAASAAPTEQQLEQELPGGHDTRKLGHDPYAALRIPEYRLFAGALCVSVLGAQAQNITIGYQIYQITHSAMSLGLLGLVMAIPILLLALPAGQLADTVSRRRIMIVTHSISASCSLALGIVSSMDLTATHTVSAIYGLMLVGNSAATFGRPARAAYMPQLVGPKVFANAVTWNSSFFEAASMIGPAIGGFLCWRGVALSYYFATVCWCVTLAALALLPDRPIPAREPGTRAVGRDLVAGLRFVLRSRLMLGAMTLDLFAVLLGGCTFLLPAFAADILHVGPVGLAFLRVAPPIGAMTTALIIARTPPLKRAGRALLFAVAGFGAVTIVFGLSRSYPLSFAMLLLTGACDNVSVVIRHTLIQLLTPDQMRGRVSAVNQVFIGSSNEIGGLESGLTAAAFGPVASVVMGGIGTILVVCGVAALWPQVRKLGGLNDVRPEPLPVHPKPRAFEVVQSA